MKNRPDERQNPVSKIKKLRPLTISFYYSYTVSNLAEVKPVKPGILALTPKASRCRQVFWLSRFLPTFPSHQSRTVVIFGKTSLRIKDYSCGDSSCFQQDSLLVPKKRKPTTQLQ